MAYGRLPSFEAPDRARSRESYDRLAPGYDATCRNIIGIRAAALAALAPRPGETVFDVACGTGPMLEPLARAVGPSGRVVGIEHSAQMLGIARSRVAQARAPVELCMGAVEELDLPWRADAMLLSYTQDVLQSAEAVARLAAHAKPGCRVIVTGIRFLPWWGLAVNAVTAWRARRYITTYSGLRRPWHLLERHCPDFRVLRTFHLGSSYLGAGTFRGWHQEEP